MAKKTQAKPRSKPKAKKAAKPPVPGTDPEHAHHIHGKGLPEGIYAQAVSPIVGGRIDPDAMLYARGMIERMAPRDPAEEMLVAQMLFAHARSMRLTSLANQQTSPEGIRVVHEYADKASNTYRRLMLALAEFRRPPKAGDSYSVIQQANIAAQQVVQNNGAPDEKATNEQGCNAATAPGETSHPPSALPADTGRDGLAEIFSPECEAVGAVNRAEDARGEISIQQERDEAR